MDDLATRLQAVAEIAVRLEAQTGCPAKLLIAQWAIESEWGAKPACHANYFGIKRATRHTKFCMVTTREVIHGQSVMEPLAFADYDSLADSCLDYAWLITRGAPYAAAWAAYQHTDDLPALIAAVAHVYATDPSYTRLALEISAQQNVADAIAAAKQISV